MFRQQANQTQRYDHSSLSSHKAQFISVWFTDWCSHTALLAAAWILLSHSVAHSISLDSALCVSLPVTQKNTLRSHMSIQTETHRQKSDLNPTWDHLQSGLDQKKSIWIQSGDNKKIYTWAASVNKAERCFPTPTQSGNDLIIWIRETSKTCRAGAPRSRSENTDLYQIHMKRYICKFCNYTQKLQMAYMLFVFTLCFLLNESIWHSSDT